MFQERGFFWREWGSAWLAPPSTILVRALLLPDLQGPLLPDLLGQLPYQSPVFVELELGVLIHIQALHLLI